MLIHIVANAAQSREGLRMFNACVFAFCAVKRSIAKDGRAHSLSAHLHPVKKAKQCARTTLGKYSSSVCEDSSFVKIHLR